MNVFARAKLRTLARLLSCPGGVFGNGTIQTANLANGSVTALKLATSVLNSGHQLLGSIAGTANAITANATPAITAYAQGQRWQITVTGTNAAGGVTIAINGLAPRNVMKRSGAAVAALAAGDLINTFTYELLDDGTQLILEGASSAGLVLIQRQVVANVAQVTFVSGLDATFDDYVIKVSGLISRTAPQSLSLQVSEDGGGTFKSGATDYTFAGWSQDDASALAALGTAANAFNTRIIIYGGSGFTTTAEAQGEIQFSRPAGTTAPKLFRAFWNAYYPNPPAAATHTDGTFVHGVYKGTNNAINALRIFGDGGNNFDGTFALYGFRKT